MPDPPPGGWGTCPTCGDATPPGVVSCPSCGKSFAQLPARGVRWKLRRLKLHKGLRMLLVVGVSLGLIATMAYALYTGPPVAADPLTHIWGLHVGPGNYTYFSGAVTGGDYIVGNFTVVNPPGAVLTEEVFNSTEFLLFHDGAPATPAAIPVTSTSALVDFSAIVTDTYYFVWLNQYPASSHLEVTLYVSTQYMSNVVME